MSQDIPDSYPEAERNRAKLAAVDELSALTVDAGLTLPQLSRVGYLGSAAVEGRSPSIDCHYLRLFAGCRGSSARNGRAAITRAGMIGP
jgi:hypothetical protein